MEVRAAALTWLNPHVYLDTVLLIGSIAASIAWFTSLGFGARRLAPLLARPRAWQVLELVVAVTMVTVAVKLALG